MRPALWLRPIFVLFVVTCSARMSIGQTFTTYPIPSPGSFPGRITLGADGNLWFTGRGSSETGDFGRINRMTPDGRVTEFRDNSGGTLPNSITRGPDGNIWFTSTWPEFFQGYIARILPSGANGGSFGVNTFGWIPYGLTAGPDGNLWFTTIGDHTTVGQLTLAGMITEFEPSAADASPSQIISGPDGNLWFTDYSGRIGRVTTSGDIVEFDVPSPSGNPSGIAFGPDGNLWFTDASLNRIGRMSPAGTFALFSIPTPGSNPDSIVAAPDGNLYFTEGSGAMIGRITPAGEITEIPVPPPSSPGGLTVGPDGAIWFTDAAVNAIRRMTLTTGLCEANATTLCLQGGRFAVTAFWSRVDGTSGVGQAIPMTGDTGAFWFFGPSNIEVVTKVLAACVDPFDSFWVFAGGLTNVQVTLTYVDTRSGASKSYLNPLRTPFQPIQDTTAFACP